MRRVAERASELGQSTLPREALPGTHRVSIHPARSDGSELQWPQAEVLL